MNCPFCNNSDTRVIDSRVFINGNSIKEEENVQLVKKDLQHMKK